MTEGRMLERDLIDAAADAPEKSLVDAGDTAAAADAPADAPEEGLVDAAAAADAPGRLRENALGLCMVEGRAGGGGSSRKDHDPHNKSACVQHRRTSSHQRARA